MHSLHFFALAASCSTSLAAGVQGFNYASTFTDGSAKLQKDFQAEFSAAKGLAGTSGGFTSARLYTMIQGGTANTPISAIPAAVSQGTGLLLGIWASAGQQLVDNEIAALKAAISTYGSSFTDLVQGISVGSEDLYRISPLGVAAKSDPGVGPSAVASYITQVKQAIAGTRLSGAPVGHVDTWTAWVNGSNQAVIDASDFIGMDAYPYFQDGMSNSINDAYKLFFDALDMTKAASGSKPVWVTETGWPVSGPTKNLGVPNTQNAQAYWQKVGCALFGQTNTWWYTLRDAAPTTPSPSFGLIDATSTKPLYDLSCSAVSSTSSASGSTASATGTASIANLGSSGRSSVTSISSGASASPTGAVNGTSVAVNGTSVAAASTIATLITSAGSNGTTTNTLALPAASGAASTTGRAGPSPSGAAGPSSSIVPASAAANAGSFVGVLGAVAAVVALL